MNTTWIEWDELCGRGDSRERCSPSFYAFARSRGSLPTASCKSFSKTNNTGVKGVFFADWSKDFCGLDFLIGREQLGVGKVLMGARARAIGEEGGEPFSLPLPSASAADFVLTVLYYRLQCDTWI